MNEINARILPHLLQNRLSETPNATEMISAAYEGYSILNLPSTLCKLFGVPLIANRPLEESLTQNLAGEYDNIILMLMDALSYNRLQGWLLEYKELQVWNELGEIGIFAPLTSITPSTTSAALTSLWSGRSTTEHAITGYEMWLKEYGIVANTILHSPITFRNDTDGLKRAGFEPEKFIRFSRLGSHLKKHGIQPYALQHRSIIHSGLSKMLMNEVEVQAFHTAADLFINLRQLLEGSANQRKYIWVYWSEVDHFGHIYGPDDERTVTEFIHFTQAFERSLYAKLNAEARQKTLLVLTADHGQIATTPNAHFDLKNHPEFKKLLHILPTGENRLPYLYIRPGKQDNVRRYIEEKWGGDFVVLEAGEMVGRSLFGPGRVNPHLFDRLGDLILIARGSAYLWWGQKENFLLGRHGGMHTDEMLVPFIAARL